jgi:hypothetical protein
LGAPGELLARDPPGLFRGLYNASTLNLGAI